MANKIGSPNLAALPLQDSSFTEIFLSLPSLGIFYGTNSQNQHDSYLSTVKKTLDERIKDPLLTWCKDPKACFFKPYSTKFEGFNGFQYGFLTPLFGILSGLGIFGVIASHPAAIVALFCTPALFELIAGVVGLCQALWHQSKSWYHHSEEEKEEAYAYFLDAMTRFALVIPLAVLSLASAPFELVRFITRSISTLITSFSDNNLVDIEELNLKNDMEPTYGSINDTTL